MKLKYHDQIKHPLWQKKRLEVMQARDFRCQECYAEENTLHIHHTFYKTGAMIWDYSVNELKCLCMKCHKEIHAVDERIKHALSQAEYGNKFEILGFIETHLIVKDYRYDGNKLIEVLQNSDSTITADPTLNYVYGASFALNIDVNDLIVILNDTKNSPLHTAYLWEIQEFNNNKKKKNARRIIK